MRIAGTVAALSALFLLLVLAAPRSRTPRDELLAVRARQTALAFSDRDTEKEGEEVKVTSPYVTTTPYTTTTSPLTSMDTAAMDDVLGSLEPTYDVSSASSPSILWKRTPCTS